LRYPSVINSWAAPEMIPTATSANQTSGDGVTQYGMLPTAQTSVVAIANHITMVMLRSPACPMRRMLTIAAAQAITPTTTTIAGNNSIVPSDRHGRSTISTPSSPAATDTARPAVTRSPNSGTDSTLRNTGIANPSAVTIASGR